jgi:hypothetical protein
METILLSIMVSIMIKFLTIIYAMVTKTPIAREPHGTHFRDAKIGFIWDDNQTPFAIG